MKKIIALLLLLCMLFTASLSLTACIEAEEPDDDVPDEPEEPEVAMLDITESFLVAYDSFNARGTELSKKFIDTYKSKYGITLERAAYTLKTGKLEIQVGMLNNRNEYKAALEDMTEFSSAGISVALVRAAEGRLMLFGTTDDAVEVAVNRALELLDDKGDIPLDTDETIVFNALDYKENKKLTGYAATDLAALSEASAITVNGRELSGFSPDVTSYKVSAKFDEGYPTVTITPLWKNSTVKYTPATEENGGIATIQITSADGKNVSVYKIEVDMNNYYETGAEIVNKNGADGAVCYVIDDGVQATATIANELMSKYNTLKLTFAVKVKDFATLTVNSSGTAYVMNNGKYTYTQTTAQKNTVSFWKGILSNDRSEVTSHTFTHAFHGTNDDGGKFQYVNNGETTVSTSESFPKGSSTKEVLAAKQVLEETLGIKSLTLALAGIGVRTSDYKLANGTVIPTYRTYLYQVLEKAIDDGKLIGTRSTFATPTSASALPSKVNTPKSVEESRVTGINALMVEPTDNTSMWTQYIDAAVNSGGLAAFCIHNIVGDKDTAAQKGHYITKSQADKLFKYACDLGSKVAIMNFTEAIMYYREWNAAKVEATTYKTESVKVKLTDSLNNSLFTEALTVKVTVPSSWTTAKSTVGSKTTTLQVKTGADGSKYVLVNLVPDAGEALITAK